MATTETILSGDGTTTQFGFTFPYIKTEDVKVELQEFDTVESTVISRVQISSFSIPSNNPTVVDFSAIGAATNYQAITGAPLTNHAVNTSNIIRVRIYRFTSADANPSTFLQGSTIRAQDLNDNFEQILYIMQERQNTLQTIQLGGIGENIIGTVSIQDDAITADKLRDSTVTDSDRAVTTNHIRDNAVTTAKIANDAVTTAKIATNAVTTAKLASDLTVDLASGTAGSPSLTFDENTGLYSPGEDRVAISTNGTGRLFVDESGLELGSGNIKLANVGRIFSADGSRGSVQISAPHDATLRRVTYGNNYYLDSDSTYKQGSAAIGGCALELTAPNANYGTLKFIQKQDPDSGGATRDALVIDQNGNVGIGTASPQSELTVRGSNPQITLEPTADTQNCRIEFALADGTVQSRIAGGGSDGSAIRFSQGPTERLRIDSDGLQVAGDITATGDISGDNVTATGNATVTNNLTVNGTGDQSLAGTLKFDSGYGSVATAYGVRAWVNFNGTGTVAIRASGNVSSITDNGTGDYTVNFTNALSDSNFSAIVTHILYLTDYRQSSGQK